jgi:alginate O-acetyltransferase complex protein AlgI
MSILSFGFILLFFLFFLLYYTVFSNHQWMLILFGSILFYCSYVPFNFIILASIILLNYLFGLLFNKLNNNHKKLLILFAIGFNVFILLFYKWLNSLILYPTLNDHLFVSGDSDDIKYSLIMPLGLSFFTFTSISYLVDIKRGTLKAEKNLALLATSFLFFPKISQGPIERTGSFLQKLKTKHDLVAQNIYNGLKLILWGLFKKLVVADRLAISVTQIYGHTSEYHGFQFLIATFFFSVQLYADFSGFIDIARGISMVLGIELSQNFTFPYFARSIKEFWSRWHITLSLWLRDYIFLPLSYFISDKLKKERYLHVKSEMWIYSIATIITFGICGIWHGTGWNFLFWGLLFALYLITSRLTRVFRKRNKFLIAFRKKSRINGTLSVIWTFLLVSFTWIFFRADSVNEALFIVKKILVFFYDLFTILLSGSFHRLKEVMIGEGFGIPYGDLMILAFSIPFLFFVEFLAKKGNILSIISTKPVYIRWSIYYLLLFIIGYFGVFSENQFIYAQF